MRLRVARLALAVLLLACAGGHAQEQAQTPVPETIQIGLSTDHVTITADFDGADLTIFGSVENTDPQLLRQGRYDVIVALVGPSREQTVRRKDRILGMWINDASASFLNVPITYSLASTRAMQDITNPETYRQLALGVDHLHLPPGDPEQTAADNTEFAKALRELKRRRGLYSERIGGVEFLSQSLFRATLPLSPDVPVGTHRARAFLFRNGVFLKENSATLIINKSGFEQTVYRLSQNHGPTYGMIAVAVALLTGWLGRIVFRRD